MASGGAGRRTVVVVRRLPEKRLRMAAAFAPIRKRAAARKGGEAVLASLLPSVKGNAALAALGDDRVLSAMAERIFAAGFVWSVRH